MKIHAYRVQRTDTRAKKFEKHLETFNGMTLAQRARVVETGQEIRIDEIDNKGSEWNLDFVYFRDRAGPGKTSRAKKTKGFDFKADEFFGEQTAMYYNEITGIAVIQYNHHGPKSQQISKYFTEMVNGIMHSYSFFECLDKTSREKLNKLAICTKFEISFASENLPTANSIKAKSVGDAIGAMKSLGGQKVQLAVGNSTGLALSAVIETVKAALRFKENISQLKVIGKVNYDDGEGPSETIDLIAQRLVLSYDVEPDKHKTLPYPARRERLKMAYEQWSGNKDIENMEEI